MKTRFDVSVMYSMKMMLEMALENRSVVFVRGGYTGIVLTK